MNWTQLLWPALALLAALVVARVVAKLACLALSVLAVLGAAAIVLWSVNA